VKPMAADGGGDAGHRSRPAADRGLPFSVNLVAMPVASAGVREQSTVQQRRERSDRRRRATRMWSRHSLFGGRRRTVRRADERDGAFVDVHGPRLFALVMVIVALNLLDAWFTLLFLSHGGRELNPVVQSVLDFGHPWPFLLMKTLGIGCACAFLTLTKNFRSARWGLWFVLAGYSALLGWHCHLLQCLHLVE
jgi:hypothetical protein